MGMDASFVASNLLALTTFHIKPRVPFQKHPKRAEPDIPQPQPPHVYIFWCPSFGASEDLNKGRVGEGF
ncbi:unnamed protein product [Diplocarpon coronariae]